MSYAKRAGATHALSTLGLSKVAYVAPALLGSAIGSGAGFLAAPENKRLEGALVGGALGGAGAAAGKAVGRLVGSSQHALAKKNLAKELAHTQPDLFASTAARNRLSDIERAIASGSNEIQGATLGGLLGAGTGVYQIAKQPYEPEPYEDPYGYRFRTQ